MKKITKKHVEKYLAERGIADSSKRVYLGILNLFVDEVAPGTTGWEERAVDWIKEKPLLPKTKSLHVSTARVFVRWCVRKGYVKDNPMMDVHIRNAKARAKRVFNKAEVKHILKSIGGGETEICEARDARDHAAILLMLHTGMRVGGAASLDIEDFSPASEGRMIARYMNKGHVGKDSTVVLKPSVIKVLDSYLELTDRTWKSPGPMFLGPHGRLSTPGLAYAIEGRFKSAGFPEACVHMLRHTAAANAYLAGADIRAIRDMLGHENIATTEGYLRSIDRMIRPAEDKIDYGEDEE